ncbi:hypothetical protein GCM10027047_31190 [Rhodococcus aerolatus]
MGTRPARTLAVTIDRPPGDVLAFVRDLQQLPRWAPGMARDVRWEDGRWLVTTAAGGEVHVEFCPENDLGVADHRVRDADGLDLTVPLRVVANGDGAEVVLTVVGDLGGDLERDADAVRADLDRLRRVLEDRD